MQAMMIYKLASTVCDDSGTLFWNSMGLGVQGISCSDAAIYGIVSNLSCLTFYGRSVRYLADHLGQYQSLDVFLSFLALPNRTPLCSSYIQVHLSTLQSGLCYLRHMSFLDGAGIGIECQAGLEDHLCTMEYVKGSYRCVSSRSKQARVTWFRPCIRVKIDGARDNRSFHVGVGQIVAGLCIL